MNRMYRSVWNSAVGAWVAVPETARSQGAGRGAVSGAAITVAAALAMGVAPAGWAQPLSVAAGSTQNLSADSEYDGGEVEGTLHIHKNIGFTNKALGTLNNHGDISSQGVFNNKATAIFVNHNNYTNDASESSGSGAPYYSYFNNEGVIKNNGHFENKAYFSNSTGSVFDNFGTLSNIGLSVNGITDYFGDIYNSGVINNKGEIFNSAKITNNADGVFNNALGAKLINHANNNSYGVLMNWGQLNNDGEIENTNWLENKGILNNSGLITSSWTIMNSGRIDNHGVLTNFASGGEFNNSGTLNNFGTINNDGTLNTSGHLKNSGTFNNHANAVLTNLAGGHWVNDTGQLLHNAGTLDNAGQWTNNGTVTNIGQWTNSATLHNRAGAVLENQAGATLTNTAAAHLQNNGTIQNAGTLENAGQWDSSGDISNSGDIQNHGVLNIDGWLRNSGIFQNHALATVNVGRGGVAGVLQGNIDNDGLLQFQRADAQAYAGQISGSGQITKRGTATLQLQGNSAAFAGSTEVQAGTLALASGAQLGGALTVFSGATLAGLGTVGAWGATTTVASGGVLSPGMATAAGHTVGRLAVLGDLALQPGATLQVHTDPASLAVDQVQVGGTAQLAGSVQLAGIASDYRVGHTYTLLTAGQVQGQFAALNAPSAYLNPYLGYSAQQVTLEWQRKTITELSPEGTASTRPITLEDLAQTSNQGAVARGVESLPSTHPLLHHVLTLPASTPAAVLSSLSGDAHASMTNGLITLGARIPTISLGQLRANMTAGLRPGAAVAQWGGVLPDSAWPASKALPAWAELVGNWQTQKGDGNAATFRQHTGGVYIGADHERASGWRFGGALGYTDARGRVGERAATSAVSSYSAAVYGGKSFARGRGQLNVLGGLAYTWHGISMQRQVLSLGQTLQADYRASTAQAFAEVGYALGQHAPQGVEPFAGITVNAQRTHRFQEHGGFAALSAERNHDTLVRTTLGVRAHRDFQWGSTQGRVRATLGWRHTMGDVRRHKTLSFEGGQPFTVAGEPLVRNAAVVGIEAELQLSRRMALVAGLQGEYGRGSRDQSAQAKLRWAF